MFSSLICVLSNSVAAFGEMVFALAFHVGLVYLCWLGSSSISGSACIGSFLHSSGILVSAFAHQSVYLHVGLSEMICLLPLCVHYICCKYNITSIIVAANNIVSILYTASTAAEVLFSIATSSVKPCFSTSKCDSNSAAASILPIFASINRRKQIWALL
jgi:hypothetical protein